MASKRIFLDFASTTPLDKKVLKAMQPYFAENFGNPSALYKEGIQARDAVTAARKSISELLNTRSEEIIFTGSGTEANNLLLQGIFNFYKGKFQPHFVTTVIEHPSVLETCRRYIEQNGGEVTYVPVEENGIVNPAAVKAALKPNTVLVSVMYANNEIGTIQPIREISRVIAEFNQSSKGNVFAEHASNSAEFAAPLGPDGPAQVSAQTLPFSPRIILHTDASQAANYVDLSFQKLGVHAMTLDASKIYGPKGVGMLALKRQIEIAPTTFGGGQERGLRAGTENVSGIVGFARALEIAQELREKESTRLAELRDYFFESVIKEMPGVIINGDRFKRLPNNCNICIPKSDAEFNVIKLDHMGISCSAASSCLNLSDDSYSYVVESLGSNGKQCRESSLRFTFGRTTTKKHIDVLLRSLKSL
jgi:cysteine desulfurase